MSATRRLFGAAIAGAFGLLAAGTASAQGSLTVYCSVQEEWCRPMMAAFERATGISVAMTRRSSGETLTQIRAEAQNPRGDVWWGGTGDPHMQAAQENLTQEYRSPMLAQLQPWAVRQAEQTGFRTVGIYAGALGYSYNAPELQRRRITAPRCWADLAKPEFRGEVQVADPNTSGTAYTMLATLVQIMGEDPAFTYLRALHRNVNQYTRSGAAPARAAATGETLVGITFLHDAVAQKVSGAPLELVGPCEGTGYEIGSMSIVRGARNMDNARRFYDWALSAEAQAIGAEAKAYQLPSNRSAPIPPQAPRFENVPLIDYDFARWGNAQERTRLIDRWQREVRAGAR
ncbi:iron ABC transporter substrate-binding protein [Falsiroseomonas bella]|uniref:Iron ABC transporter substrate-binding protein n=1 Tax=Falsiroseomonas bella TaxID=2184016 RepID=A0A317FAS9_9PROT|nr:ABC transporter substrate-binding protein [Falsiroseomonas bella]PWS35019.1 iron ABC transporter substrate-binding protein [Falsiroseomonas bella]